MSSIFQPFPLASRGVSRGLLPHRLGLLLAILLTLAAAAPAVAQGAGEEGFLSHSLSLEQRLMREDLSAFEQATAAETQARQQVGEAITQLGSLVAANASGTAAATNLGRAEQRMTEAAAAWREAAGRTEAALARVEMRLQRMRLLTALGASTVATSVSPNLTGAWRVRVQPDGAVGVYDLRQDGTVLSGTYRMENGLGGSLRGSLAGRRLRLERLDASQGFESIFYGEVNAAADVISGQWTPTEFADGGSGGGAWRAVLTGGNAP